MFETGKKIPFDNQSKIIIMSDCHRGDGSWADNFSKNKNIYLSALAHYYIDDFTYIELGDGDELWENSNISDIIEVHEDVFWLLSKFYREGRLYFIYGNHDIDKRSASYVKKNFYQYFDAREKKLIPLFPDIKIHESIVLEYVSTGEKILLVHGHQADPLNDQWWRLSKFLVRYLWKPLELFGVNDPTSAAKNYKKKESMAKKLTEWVEKEQHLLIAGHNHMPAYADIGEPPYFNDGTCIHPNCITGIEIANGYITLVKWCIKSRYNGTLYIGRDILAGPNKLEDYFKLNKSISSLT